MSVAETLFTPTVVAKFEAVSVFSTTNGDAAGVASPDRGNDEAGEAVDGNVNANSFCDDAAGDWVSNRDEAMKELSPSFLDACVTFAVLLLPPDLKRVTPEARAPGCV